MRNQAIFFLAIGGCAYALLTTEVPDEAPAVQQHSRALPMAAVVSEDSGVRERDPGFSGDETVIDRRGGQFHLTAQVDGQDAEFLIDTGADMVALSVDEAERLGFSIDPASFRPLTQTASGMGNGAVVRLASLEVAGQTFTDVDALVLEGLPVNLLGQSVLGRLGQVSLEGNRMVIRR